MRERESSDEQMRLILADLHERLTTARSRYEALVEWRSANTARIELATNERRSLQPLELERHGLTPGRILRKVPGQGRNFVEYFFDAANDWIATCRHETPYGYYEDFHESDGNRVYGTLYDYHAPDKQPINCSVAVREAGLVTIYASHGKNGWRYEEYLRDEDGHVSRIRSVALSPNLKDPRTSEVSVEYGAAGQISSMTQVWDSGEVEPLPPRRRRSHRGL